MKFYIIYSILLILRLLAHLTSQCGYIHPDEFFQTTEISTGNVLNFSIDAPWEFTISYPIRSYAIIELFLNIPLKIFLMFRTFTNFIVPSLNPLKFFRILTVLCSFIVDYSIYFVCKKLFINFKYGLLLHGISHVSIVYLARTFTNTWETQIFSLFLIMFHQSEKNNIQNEICQGILISIGIFCRPTFILFVLPLIFTKIISFKSLNEFFKFVFNETFGFVSASIILISYDTFKYKNSKDLSFIITPWNFIYYNINRENLLKHGYHPWYTHIVANLPQLFCIVLIVILLGLFLGPRHKNFNCLLFYLSFPVFFLSIFPHQELRFLLPLTPLTMILVSSVLEQIKDRYRIIKFVLISHLVFSLISVIFWGYLHEGGLLKASELVRLNIQSSSVKSCHKIISYKTLLLPKFLFEFPLDAKCNHTVYNLMGIPENQFWDEIFHIKQQKLSSTIEQSIIHLIFPKAFRFKKTENFQLIGTKKSDHNILGHINTDLWPPQVSWWNFFSLQYQSFHA